MSTEPAAAQLAGASYFDTRHAINQFPIPAGWSVRSRNPSDPSSGFEASAFQRGNEIVISYSGTDPNAAGLFSKDMQANLQIIRGDWTAQLLQAAEYYLEIRAANPTATITLTGHSLGGGLASLVAVFFGVKAQTFDQAPFAKSATALSDNASTLLSALTTKLDANGNRVYSAAMLEPLTQYLELRGPNTPIPRSDLVNTIQVEGEVLDASLIGGVYDRIGNAAVSLSNGQITSKTSLHSQLLLTAFVQSAQTATSGAFLKFLRSACGVLMLGLSTQSFAATEHHWQEEVLLHDGRKIVAERSQTYGGRREVGQGPPIRELRISFELPGTGKKISWVSEYGEELGRTNFKLLALHVLDDVPYLVAVPNLCLSYNKWGRPNPPYVVFKHDGSDWIRIDLKALPPVFKARNLTVDTLGSQSTLGEHPHMSASMIESLNQRLEQPEYRSILREELPKGALGITSCEPLVYYKCGWGSPGELNRKYFENTCK